MGIICIDLCFARPAWGSCASIGASWRPIESETSKSLVGLPFPMAVGRRSTDDTTVILVEPLLQNAIAPCTQFNGKLPLFLSFLTWLGFAIFRSVACQQSSGGPLPAVQGSAPTMASESPDELGSLSSSVTTRPGVSMPRLLYEIDYHGQTERDIKSCLKDAVQEGFWGIDIAGQPGNFYEAGADAALASIFASGVARNNLFIQTKINPKYAAALDADASIAERVELLISNLLSNLNLTYIDSLVLHSSYDEHDEIMEAWRAMEAAERSGFVRQLGIWNFASLTQLKDLYKDAIVKPAIVQQLVFIDTIYEREMRAWCVDMGIYVQSLRAFSVHRRALASNMMQVLALKYGVDPPVLLLRYVMGLHVVPLISMGDTKMRTYLNASRVALTTDDSVSIGALLGRRGNEPEGAENWQREVTSARPLEDFVSHVEAMRDCAQHARWDDGISVLWKRHSICRQPSPLEQPKIVVALASHVVLESRLMYLKQCLASVTAQQEYWPAALFASISTSTTELMQSVRKIFKEFEETVVQKGMKVYVYFRAVPLSQFSHLASLVGPLCGFAQDLDPSKWGVENELWHDTAEEDCTVQERLSSIWLIFTDDDDLWHPLRTRIYLEAITTAMKSHGIAPVAVPVYAVNTASAVDCASAAGVNLMLMEGRAGIVCGNETQAKKRPFLEYWLHAVPLRVFFDFLLCTPPEVLAEITCDVRFAKFIRDHSGLPPALTLSPGGHYLPDIFWMYFYRNHDDQILRNLQRPRIERTDLELAKSITDLLTCSYAGHYLLGEENTTRQLGQNAIEKICAQIRTNMHTLITHGTLDIGHVVSVCLEMARLTDTPDETCWAQMTYDLAYKLLPILSPPAIDHLGSRRAYLPLEAMDEIGEGPHKHFLDALAHYVDQLKISCLQSTFDEDEVADHPSMF